MVFSPLQAQNGFAPIYRMESGMETKVNVSILGNFYRAIIQQSILIFAIRENFTFFFSNCTHQASTQYCKNQPY